MRSKNVGWALAGLPVDFRGEDAAFRDGMSRFPALRRRPSARRRPAHDHLDHAAQRHPDLPGNFKQHATRLREIARVLNDTGLRFGLEYVGPKTLWAAQRYPFSHTMAETRELIAEIGPAECRDGPGLLALVSRRR